MIRAKQNVQTINVHIVMNVKGNVQLIFALGAGSVKQSVQRMLVKNVINALLCVIEQNVSNADSAMQNVTVRRALIVENVSIAQIAVQVQSAPK